MKNLLTSKRLLLTPLVLILGTSASLQAGGGPLGAFVRATAAGFGVYCGIIVAHKLMKLVPVQDQKPINTPKPIRNEQGQADRQQCSLEGYLELNGQKRTFCLGKRQSP